MPQVAFATNNGAVSPVNRDTGASSWESILPIDTLISSDKLLCQRDHSAREGDSFYLAKSGDTHTQKKHDKAAPVEGAPPQAHSLCEKATFLQHTL